MPLLKQAHFRLKKRAASGVDGVTWAEYGERLDERLLDLQDRVQRGSYHPQPVRRVSIEKVDGRLRPLGVPALEDKIVQQAARMVLEPIYEAMFIGFSYGYRPRRSAHAHDALDALAVEIGRKVNHVLDADIRSFFDTTTHRPDVQTVSEPRKPRLFVQPGLSAWLAMHEPLPDDRVDRR